LRIAGRLGCGGGLEFFLFSVFEPLGLEEGENYHAHGAVSAPMRYNGLLLDRDGMKHMAR